MPEAHDVPGTRKFVALMKYPKGPRPPLWESGVESREYEPPFRIGHGWALRIPGSWRAVLIGTWQEEDEEPDEEERLVAALRGHDLEDDVDDIKEWAR